MKTFKISAGHCCLYGYGTKKITKYCNSGEWFCLLCSCIPAGTSPFSSSIDSGFIKDRLVEYFISDRLVFVTEKSHVKN